MDFLLGLLSRWAHILAAMAAVGGMIFARFALLPAADGMTPDQRVSLLDAVRMRWSKVVAAAIAFLLLSGFYNFFIIIQKPNGLPPQYHMLFGLKFILALAIFFLASLLSGRTELAKKFRQNHKLWLNVTLAMAVTVVCLSGVMRTMSTVKRPVPQENHAASANPVLVGDPPSR